ncbi:MAG: nitroreductase family protein [bacterium]|jgi:nitroreductase
MDAIECLKTRRSVRSYQNRAVPKEILEDIVDCGRLAATGMNLQPWEFVVVTDKERLQAIADLTDYGKFIPDAGACIAVICSENKFYVEDGSAATENILLAAKAHGLGSCWVSADKKIYADPIREYLGAPAGFKLLSLVTIGYPDDEATHKTKRPLNEVIHWEKF